MIRSTLCIALLFIGGVAHAESALLANDVSTQISTVGAKSTLDLAYASEEKWEQLLAGIATGTKEWLIIANQLHLASDAGASEQLCFAVGEALEHNPDNVLALSLSEFGVRSVCSGPDVDDQRFNSYKLSMSAIDLRLKMLRAIKDNTLRKSRDSCIAILEEAKVGIAKFYGVEK